MSVFSPKGPRNVRPGKKLVPKDRLNRPPKPRADLLGSVAGHLQSVSNSRKAAKKSAQARFYKPVIGVPWPEIIDAHVRVRPKAEKAARKVAEKLNLDQKAEKALQRIYEMGMADRQVSNEETGEVTTVPLYGPSGSLAALQTFLTYTREKPKETKQVHLTAEDLLAEIEDD